MGRWDSLSLAEWAPVAESTFLPSPHREDQEPRERRHFHRLWPDSGEVPDRGWCGTGNVKLTLGSQFGAGGMRLIRARAGVVS